MHITICGSVEFSPKIIEIKGALEKMGHQVDIPLFTQKMENGEITYQSYLAAREKDGGDILMRKPEEIDMIKRYFTRIRD